MTKMLEMLNHSSASPLCGLPHLTNARSSSVNNVFIILHDAVAEHHSRQAPAAGGREPTTLPAAAGRAVIRRTRLSENGHRALVWHRQPRRHAGRDRAAPLASWRGGAAELANTVEWIELRQIMPLLPIRLSMAAVSQAAYFEAYLRLE
jgi:hypothetical protein